ncbi:hypothetical protein ZORO111903_13815 [Zobellia roscoffensis]|uniref:hypothetical protein n=1 Tax=Zobellia roscoffensis TaxID=2779508 RepID=UPI00188D95D4|nr:hypothetical protein [Zobellia roscoffensis]
MKNKIIILAITLLFGAAPTVFGQSLQQTSGKISFLRINEVGTSFGPNKDKIDSEVIIKFSGNTGKAFGFQLRKDANSLVHQGMLDLLRDAFDKNYRVTIDFTASKGNDVRPADKNGEIIRLWITK